MIHLLGILALGGYLFSVLFGSIGFLRRSKEFVRFGGYTHRGGLFALILLVTVTLLNEPKFFGIGDYLLLGALALDAGYLLLRSDYLVLRIFVSSAVLLFLGSSSFLLHADYTHAPFPSGGVFLSIHILPALLAEVAVIGALIVCGVYVLQSKLLKKKKLDAESFRGPSLSLLEALFKRMLLVGFFCMTVAVTTGVLWAFRFHVALLRFDGTELFAYCSWTLMAVLLHLLYGKGWSMQRLSRHTLRALSALIVLYGGTLLLRGLLYG